MWCHFVLGASHSDPNVRARRPLIQLGSDNPSSITIRRYMLNQRARERYARQLVLPGFGEEVQKKLLDSSVLIIGAGGLGSPSSLYLAAAGFGRIGIIDADAVDLSNLHRQILFTEDDIGRDKVDVAAERLRRLDRKSTRLNSSHVAISY